MRIGTAPSKPWACRSSRVANLDLVRSIYANLARRDFFERADWHTPRLSRCVSEDQNPATEGAGGRGGGAAEFLSIYSPAFEVAARCRVPMRHRSLQCAVDPRFEPVLFSAGEEVCSKRSVANETRLTYAIRFA
jgi:hypothetical protein